MFPHLNKVSVELRYLFKPLKSAAIVSSVHGVLLFRKNPLAFFQRFEPVMIK